MGAAVVRASGPVRESSSSASGCTGIRSDTVPRLFPRSQRSVGCAAQTRVSSPGQNASASARVAGGTSAARPSRVLIVGTATAGGRRAGSALTASSSATAGTEKASHASA